MSDQQELVRWFNERRPINRAPLEPRVYEVTDTIRVREMMALKLCGAGGQDRSANPGWNPYRCGTILDWKGGPGKPVLDFTSVCGLVLDGINIRANDASHGMLFHHGKGTLSIELNHCSVIGGDIGIQWGTFWGEHTTANATINNFHFEAQRQASYRIVNSQSLEHLLLRPCFSSTPIAIDVQGGGDVSVLGGGSYEVGQFLRLGRIGSNARGFDVRSFRFDGKKTRTAWLTCEDTDEGKAYGTVLFASCSQNNGQKESELPLFTVPPGCRVVASCNGFHGSVHEWAHLYGTQKMPAELIVEYCDGLSPDGLEQLVTSKGPRSYYKFKTVGSLMSDSRSVSTFPEDRR